MIKVVATFEIQDTFKITGRGIILLGEHVCGESVLIGDFIEFTFEEQDLVREIKGLDVPMRTEPKNLGAGILIKTESDKEFASLYEWEPNKLIAKIVRKIED